MEPLQIVPATPPVEATLRILLNSVPYLIGAAVVRQPAGPDAVAAEVGRNPWLFDRRLTTLQLPDDTLPANRAVALDWPVPYQAEWVGVPPRLLISRLVFGDRTVGVLLGTLITRETLGPQTREAIDLSCELIASAMAVQWAALLAAPAFASPGAAGSDRGVAEPAAPSPRPDNSASSFASQQISEVSALQHPSAATPPPARMAAESSPISAIEAQIGAAVAAADDARAIGRILRDAMNDVSEASAFAVALFHADRPEVAYRYKVVGVDAASAELGRQAVDDSPSCFAVRNAERWHSFERSVTLDGERRRVGVLQVPLAEANDAIGVVTLQTFREDGFMPTELELVAAIVRATTPAFARVRGAGRFQPSTAAQPAGAPPQAQAATPQPRPAAPVSAEPENTDDVLADALARCAAAGMRTAFIVGLDPEAGLLLGDRVSGSPEAGAVDRLLGISEARFAISVDDRYNAISRACREARVVSAPTVHELVQPAHDWNEAILVERAAGGGRSAIAPIIVNGDVVGALVAGPQAEELGPVQLDRLRAIVDAAGDRLAAAWRLATLGSGTRSEHVA